MTLHWLAVDRSSPLIPLNKVWNGVADGLCSGGIAPLLELDDGDGGVGALGGDAA